MEGKSIFTGFAGRDELLEWHKGQSDRLPEINGHIHTPYSFSAFDHIEQAFRMAKSEGISVLGINDFYTTAGYDEFAALARQYDVFPLFNIEFMALQHDLQDADIRVNDPNNPGRTYFSGKGLRYPVKMGEASERVISELQQESNRQTYQMVEKLNAFFSTIQADIRFDAAELHREIAKGLLRERHIAQAVRRAVYEKETSSDGRKKLLGKIFSGKAVKSSPDDHAAVENEIRGNLLKAGGAAFVPEDPKAFLSLGKVIEIITDAGGIPCYPVLLDDPKGHFTEYEADWEKLQKELLKNDVYALELIPGRNDCEILKKFVSYFHRNGFLVTYGSEHNTPKLDPLKITCRNQVELDDELKAINYEGTAVIAAHQYLVALGEEGYLAGKKAKTAEKEKFAALGKAVIAKYLNR